MSLEKKVQESDVIIPNNFIEEITLWNFIRGELTINYVCGNCSQFNINVSKKIDYPKLECGNCGLFNTIPTTYGIEKYY